MEKVTESFFVVDKNGVRHKVNKWQTENSSTTLAGTDRWFGLPSYRLDASGHPLNTDENQKTFKHFATQEVFTRI